MTFAMAQQLPSTGTKLKSEVIELVHSSYEPGSADDASENVNLARQMEVSWVVVYGYHFSVRCQEIVRLRGLRQLLIDETGHHDHYYADIVLNQNLHVHEGLYANREPYTRLLL